MNSDQKDQKSAFVIIQLVNNVLMKCELEEYFRPLPLGCQTYQLQIATNSQDTPEALNERIHRLVKRLLEEKGFKTGVVNTLNKTVVSSERISL